MPPGAPYAAPTAERMPPGAPYAPPAGQQATVGGHGYPPPPAGQQPFGPQHQYAQQHQPGWPGAGMPQARPPLPQFNFDIKRLGTPELVVGGASAVLLLSLFLPWFGAFGFTQSGLSAHGYLALALLAAVAALTYLLLRAGWDTLPFKLPVAHTPLLLILTAVQLLIVLLGFLLKPVSFASWGFGAYLGLLAALVACGTIVVPAIRSLQSQY